MKIAVFGYYNALNAGDDRLQFCVTRLVQGNTVVFLPHYLPPPIEYLKTFDWILIGGGGLVFEPVGIWANSKRWLRHCRAKIGVLGLGVTRVSPHLLQDITQIIERSEFFYVRDHVSQALLNHHPKVTVYPDLSWCFPLTQASLKTCDVNTYGEAQTVALNLLPCAWKAFNIDDWVNALSGYKILPFPLHFGKARDADLLRRYFGDSTPTEFSLQPLIKSDILVACRFHAIIFAMQIGKPFIAINYDDKVQRLMADADLLECCLETTQPEQLREKIQFVLHNWIALNQKVRDFVELQEKRSEQLTQSVQAHLSTQSAWVETPLSAFKSNLKSKAARLLQRP